MKNIESKLETILSKVEALLPQDEKKTMGGIELAAEITGFAIPTIYSLISRREIPSYKKGKRLYFKRKELEDWIEGGRRKTAQEIALLAKNRTR